MIVELQPNQIKLARLFRAQGPKAATNIGFGGPRGGTKSHSIRAIALDCLDTYPGCRVFIVRTNWTDLYENHLLKFQQDYPWMADFWNGQNKEWRFPNKSQLALKYADTENDVEKLARGPEAMFMLIDQAEQFTENQLKMMKTSNRWPGVPISQCKTGHFFNPGGPGNQFLKRVYYDRDNHQDEPREDYVFLQSKGWENYEWFRGTGLYGSAKEFYEDSDKNRFENFIRHTGYGRELHRKPPSIRIGELLGSFDHFAGQYYGGVWDEHMHVLPQARAELIIQPWWQRWMAADWGMQHNTAVGWFASGKLKPQLAEKYLGLAVTHEIEVIIQYRELVFNEVPEYDAAKMIAEATPVEERKLISKIFFSKEEFGERGSAKIMQPVLKTYGLPSLVPAENRRTTVRGVGEEQERIGGWRFLYNLFNQTVQLSQVSIADQAYSNGPMLLIAHECAKTRKAIPTLMRDKDNPDDVMKFDSEADDIGDMIRYGMTEKMNSKDKPLEVQAREIAESIPGIGAELHTTRALVMKQFWVDHAPKRGGRGSHWR